MEKNVLKQSHYESSTVNGMDVGRNDHNQKENVYRHFHKTSTTCYLLILPQPTDFNGLRLRPRNKI